MRVDVSAIKKMARNLERVFSGLLSVQVVETASTGIGAAKPMADFWQTASGLIAAADRIGKVDADVVPQLKALYRNAEKANANGQRRIYLPASVTRSR